MAETGKQFLLRLLGRAVAAIVIGCGIIYGLDALVLQGRIWTHGAAFGTVTVRPYYAIPRKDQKMELMFDDPRDEACVNALLPHKGDAPCWYLRRHPDKRIDL
jgi:hypothetical protein